jgi:hypothetical protein
MRKINVVPFSLVPYSYQDLEELPIMRKLLFIFSSGGFSESLRSTLTRRYLLALQTARFSRVPGSVPSQPPAYKYLA